MEKIRNLSIRKTIVLYMTVNLILCFFLSEIIVRSSERRQQSIWQKYVTEETAGDYTAGPLSVPRVSNYEMTGEDVLLSEFCDAVQTWTRLLLPSLGMVVAVFLFYRNKIRRPLRELVSGSAMIADNNLDFTLSYDNRDELGTLTREFEKMRKQLAENNKRMWELLEQEKILKAAIAHDIRSPLATLRGYQEMLLEFVPQQQLDKQQLIGILEAEMTQIDRLNDFVDTMADLSRLDSRELHYRKTDLQELAEQLRETALLSAENTGLSCRVTVAAEEAERTFDPAIVTEVAENLIANALRFAGSEIRITLDVNKDMLELTVTDDGTGFQDDTETVTGAYYHANPEDDLKHFGLGLYICKIYCEKHGGRLLAANGEQGGAIVKALFKTDERQDI